MKQVIPAPDYNCFPSAYGKFQVLKYAYSPLIQGHDTLIQPLAVELLITKKAGKFLPAFLM